MTGQGDPAASFVDLAGRHERMFWLDGGGSRDWSGRRSILGALAEEDVSLTYDASAAAVTRHADGRSDIVGSDIFEVLAEEVDRDEGDPAVSWVGYLGYACRRDLPARPDPFGAPDAVWMRVRDPLVVEHAGPHPHAVSPGPASPPEPVPQSYAEAFDQVQRELRAGNSYEVNLTYRETI
ncbi:MAG: anthranilate synthase component I family protein, partial [Actinomycetes bacterium]